MRDDNAALERNTILGTGGAVFTLQVQRMLRESSGEIRRRLFIDIDQAVSWTAERLTGPEQARLIEFIRESDSDLVRPDGTFFHWRSDLPASQADAAPQSPRPDRPPKAGR